MFHYSDFDVSKSKKYCRFCGRPLKANSSLVQGCGDTCRNKNRFRRYRVVKVGGESGGILRLDENRTNTDSNQ